VERRLAALGERLRVLREELAVTDEQLAALADEAGDLHLRSLVSETPMAERDHRDAERHAAAMRRHRADVQAEVERAEAEQDRLLDRLHEALG
jgi:chromosome segregation ATPase